MPSKVKHPGINTTLQSKKKVKSSRFSHSLNYINARSYNFLMFKIKKQELPPDAKIYNISHKNISWRDSVTVHSLGSLSKNALKVKNSQENVCLLMFDEVSIDLNIHIATNY